MSRERVLVEISGTLDAIHALNETPARILQIQKLSVIKLLRSLKPEASRSIRQEYNIKKNRLDKGLSVRQSSQGISLLGSGKGIGLVNFGATYSRTFRGKISIGAKFSELKGIKKQYYEGSFIAQNINGTPALFERTGAPKVVPTKGRYVGRTIKRGPRKGQKLLREPLAVLFGPSVAQMLKHGRRPERLVDFAIRTLQAEQARLLGGS